MESIFSLVYEIIAKTEMPSETIREVSTHCKNSDMTTFLQVYLLNFPSFDETKHKIQAGAFILRNQHTCHCGEAAAIADKKSDSRNSRERMQEKYVEQTEEFCDEFNALKMPLLVEEIRGKERSDLWMMNSALKF